MPSLTDLGTAGLRSIDTLMLKQSRGPADANPQGEREP
jgi:hypothetical protein